MKLIVLTAGAVATSLLLTGCGSGEGDRAGAVDDTPVAEAESTTSTTSGQVGDPALVQLCEVLASALAGDLDAVRSTFDHGPLHALADTAIDVDRTVAARLLTAKESVESGLTDPAVTADQIAVELRALVDAVSEAHTVTDTPQPPCEDLP